MVPSGVLSAAGERVAFAVDGLSRVLDVSQAKFSFSTPEDTVHRNTHTSHDQKSSSILGENMRVPAVLVTVPSNACASAPITDT